MALIAALIREIVARPATEIDSPGRQIEFRTSSRTSRTHEPEPLTTKIRGRSFEPYLVTDVDLLALKCCFGIAQSNEVAIQIHMVGDGGCLFTCCYIRLADNYELPFWEKLRFGVFVTSDWFQSREIAFRRTYKHTIFGRRASADESAN